MSIPLPKDDVLRAVGGDHQDVVGLAADREVGDLGAAAAGGVEDDGGEVGGVAADPDVADLAGDAAAEVWRRC